MYKSPIEVIPEQINMQLENEIYKAVGNVGINVDREELLKALAYDRGQYEQGYRDALKEQPQWISVEDRLPELRKAVLAYAPLHKNIWAVTLHEDGNWYYWSLLTRLYDPVWEGGPITHWMPLPEPPEGVKQDDIQ